MAETMYRATSKFLIASPSKVRPVADIVRNKNCTEAIGILENMPQKGAELVLATVKSAVANALFLNKKLDESMLFISELRVDDGPRMKRLAYRSRGRADLTLKRMCHITVVVDEKAGE